MKPKSSVPIAPVNLAEQLIDIVLENAFADMPFQSKGKTEQPELGIKDLTECKREIWAAIDAEQKCKVINCTGRAFICSKHYEAGLREFYYKGIEYQKTVKSKEG
jgi:hypothetical protein